jgi:hypothetical protein
MSIFLSDIWLDCQAADSETMKTQTKEKVAY